jgi:hypothetical protein
MIYRGPGFSAVFHFPLPPPLPSVSSTGRHTGRLRRRDNLLTVEGGEVGGGAKSYVGEKSWSSKKHSTLYGGSGAAGIWHLFIYIKKHFQRRAVGIVCNSVMVSGGNINHSGPCFQDTEPHMEPTLLPTLLRHHRPSAQSLLILGKRIFMRTQNTVSCTFDCLILFRHQCT